MDLVVAATVREVEGPQFVAENMLELDAHMGEQISLEQCDRCGCAGYAITHTGLICSGDDIHGEGCGAWYPYQHIEAERVSGCPPAPLYEED